MVIHNNLHETQNQTTWRSYPPCLLYASETWRITVKLANKLNALHQRCLRIILKIRYRDHVNNDEILRKTQSDTLIKMITTQRLKLAGHIIRMEDNRCAKTALSWVPSNGKRKRGRPRITWRRTFKNNLERAGTTWDEAITLAKDRDAWKLFASRCPVMDWRT